MRKLAVITTHPIQYYAPVFRLLHQRGKIQLMVFYTAGGSDKTLYDTGFKQNITWDIPLLDGYDYTWVTNTAKDPGSHHFQGIVNPGLIAQINAWQPDAVLVIGWAYRSHFKAMRYYKNKLPVYFRGDSTLLDEQGGIKQFRRELMLRWVYRYVDHAFYVGANNLAYFKKYGLKDKQLTFAPHAVDNERFGADRTAEAKQLRNSFGIADNDIVILFAGKLDEKKAPVLLFDSFLKLNKPGVHLLFTGDGELKYTLQQKSAGQQNVHFLSFQNQSYMPVVYQCCNLYCLPSKGPAETWGLAVNEAMACGKAILVSDKAGCAADLVSVENGAVFHSDNIDDLTAALTRLLLSRETLDKLGLASKKIIQPWNFAHIASAIEEKLISEPDR